MKSKIDSIRAKITKLKSMHGPRAKISSEIWNEIRILTKNQSIKEISQYIGIDPYYAQAKLNKHTKKSIRKAATTTLPTALIQLSNSPLPVLEMTLNNGTTIKVFSP